MSHVFRHPRVVRDAVLAAAAPPPAWVAKLRLLEPLNRAFDYADDFSFDLDQIAGRAARLKAEEAAL